MSIFRRLFLLMLSSGLTTAYATTLTELLQNISYSHISSYDYLSTRQQPAEPNVVDYINWNVNASLNYRYDNSLAFRTNGRISYDLGAPERLERRSLEAQNEASFAQFNLLRLQIDVELEVLASYCRSLYLENLGPTFTQMAQYATLPLETEFWAARTRRIVHDQQIALATLERYVPSHNEAVQKNGASGDARTCNLRSQFVLPRLDTYDLMNHPDIRAAVLEQQQSELQRQFYLQPATPNLWLSGSLDVGAETPRGSIGIGLDVPLPIDGVISSLSSRGSMDDVDVTLSLSSDNFRASQLNASQPSLSDDYILEEITLVRRRIQEAEMTEEVSRARAALVWEQLRLTLNKPVDFSHDNLLDEVVATGAPQVLELYLDALSASFEHQMSMLETIRAWGIRPTTLLSTPEQ